MSSLNSGQFQTPITQAPDLKFTPEPLPGETNKKPIAKELPTLTPEQRQAAREQSAKKAAESGKTVVVGKPMAFTAVNRASLPETPAERAAKDAAAKAERQKTLDLNYEIEKSSKPRHQTPRAVVQAVLGGTVLKRHAFGVTEAEPTVAPGPTPGNKFSEPRYVPHIPRTKPAINEDLAAKTGLEAPAETSVKVGLRKAARELARKNAAPGETAPEKKFTRKELNRAALSLARAHWEKTAPTADLSAYSAQQKAHHAKHAKWLLDNPMPAADTPEREEWSKNHAAWKKANPAPSTKPLDDARELSNTLFKQSDAYKSPRSYLKKALKLDNVAAVDIHVEDHIRKTAAAEATEATPAPAKPAIARPPVVRTLPDISPERSAAVETFVKNPLSYHFGKGNTEGKG